MSPLESRKKLLIAESEVNRAALVGEAFAFSTDVRALTARAKSFGTLASSAAIVASFLGGKPSSDTKSSWLQTAFKGAGLISNLWLVFRSRRREPKDE